MRANIVVAVGVVGEREDVENFLRMMEIDFGKRCEKAAETIFAGRIEILPIPEASAIDELQ